MPRTQMRKQQRRPWRRLSSAAPDGFTLVESLIAVSIFVILLGGLGGVYTTFSRTHRELRAQQRLQQDLQSFFEVLDREVRTGFGTTFAGGGTTFSLQNQNLQCVTYTLDQGRLYRAADTGAGCTVPGTPQPLTSRSTEILRLAFSAIKTPGVDNNGTLADTGDDLLKGQQGRVTVSLKACPKSRSSDTECIVIQTTITSRQYGPPPL